MPRKRAVSVGLLLLFICTALPLRTQAQDSMATVFVLVLDRKGDPVEDLQQNELKIFEGKDERPIESIRRNPEAPKTIGFLVDKSPSAIGFLHGLDKDLQSRRLQGVVIRQGDSAFVATFG